MLEKKITTIAYEQIILPDGTRPVMYPLSEIGGRMAAQTAAMLVQNYMGGKGILLGGMPGVPPAEVVILGAGVAGTYAAKSFLGMGAQVTILDVKHEPLQSILQQHPEVVTMFATKANIERACTYADVLVATASVQGQLAPTLVTREMVRSMRPRSLIMDLSIDQGGCVETSRPTSHENPTFIDEEIIHYCVPNMSSAVARTATNVFFNAAFPYILEIADKGIQKAREDNPAIEHAINTHDGQLVNLSPISKK